MLSWTQHSRSSCSCLFWLAFQFPCPTALLPRANSSWAHGDRNRVCAIPQHTDPANPVFLAGLPKHPLQPETNGTYFSTVLAHGTLCAGIPSHLLLPTVSLLSSLRRSYSSFRTQFKMSAQPGTLSEPVGFLPWGPHYCAGEPPLCFAFMPPSWVWVCFQDLVYCCGTYSWWLSVSCWQMNGKWAERNGGWIINVCLQ